MEKPLAIQDYPSTADLQERTLLISNVTPDLSFDRSTDFFEDLKTLVGYRKRQTTTKVDYCHQLLVSSMGVQYQSKVTPPG